MTMLETTFGRPCLPAWRWAGGSLASGTPAPKTPKPKARDGPTQATDAGGESEAGRGAPSSSSPKEGKKRQISADQRADFEKAMARYESAKKSGGLSGGECTSVADGFKPAADETRCCWRRASTRAPCWPNAAARTTPIRIWRGPAKYGPAIANLGYIAWKKGDTGRGRVAVQAAIDEDPLHTVEARNNLAQIQRDKARRARAREEKKQYVQAVRTCAPCSPSTATTCRRSRRWRSSTTT